VRASVAAARHDLGPDAFHLVGEESNVLSATQPHDAKGMSEIRNDAKSVGPDGTGRAEQRDGFHSLESDTGVSCMILADSDPD
jgi:hypothetical protein